MQCAIRGVSVVACLQVVLGGCTDAPGALRLSLTADKATIAAQESISLTATLTAVDGPVCLVRPYRFIAEVSRSGADADAMSTDETVVRCGTGTVECLLLSPVLLPATLLDVGNVMGRYTVMAKGEHKQHDLRISLHRRRGRDYCVLGSPCRTSDSHATWPAGRYVVKVLLQNRTESAIGMFPHPLFWRPYSQPVEAEIAVEIAE